MTKIKIAFGNWLIKIGRKLAPDAYADVLELLNDHAEKVIAKAREAGRAARKPKQILFAHKVDQTPPESGTLQ